MRWILLLIIYSLSLQFETTGQHQSLNANIACKTLASLLNIQLNPPSVNATIQNSFEEEGLLIQDISWTCEDGKVVPAFVIKKSDNNDKLPAVICLHGSSGSRESMVTRQFGIGEWTRHGSNTSHIRLLGWARELAKRGYLVLAITQRGLGSRSPSTSHEAKIQLVNGRTAMGAIIDEIRQGVSYLEKRTDVNPERIGITGMSFGGIVAFYMSVVDNRIAASAPICGGVGSVDVFINKGNIDYHGFYWWVPGIVSHGDQAWFAAAMAPKPLMLWAPTEDIGMPKEAVDQFVGIVKPAYKCSGSPGNLIVHQPPGEHNFTLEAFEEMVKFFGSHL